VRLIFNAICAVSNKSRNSSELPIKELADNITTYRCSTLNNMKSGGKYYRATRSVLSARKLIKSLNKNITFTLSRVYAAALLTIRRV
jgi:hypothetical protein